jgi:NADPH-dependent curcumin reductase CurA
MVGEEHFRFTAAPVPEPGPGEYLVRTLCVSVDPAMRGWLADRPSYVPPVQLGEVMRAPGVGRVVQSHDPCAPVGQLVMGFTGWQDYVVPRDGLLGIRPLSAGVSPEMALSVVGHTGMTAYFGLFDVGKPSAGETVVVSGAAGAVGSVAGQLSKIRGCRVVGIAGRATKCAWVTDELGFDACINYRTEDVGRRLDETCPDGIDLYFDNVAGPLLELVLARINLHARIVRRGSISTYNATEPQPGPANLHMLIVKRARMEGFLIFDYADRYDEAARRWASGSWPGS